MREVMRTHSDRSYEKTVRIIAIITIATGILVMYAWIFDIDFLKSIFPNAPTMKFNTAISFIMSGISLYFIARIREGDLRKSHIFLPVTIMVIFLMMVSIILSIFIKVQTGIETAFIEEKSAVLTIVPRPPSLATIACFVMMIALGISALYSVRFFTKLSTLLGLAILVLGSISIIGYVVGQPALYYYVEGISTGMAPHTSALFVLLGYAFTLLGKTKEIELAQLKRATLSKKLLSIFLIVSVIPLIITSILIYTTIQQQLQLEAQKTLEVSSIELSNALKINYLLRKQQIEFLATRDLIQNLLTEYDKKDSGLTINGQNVQITRELTIKDLEEFRSTSGYELGVDVTHGFYQIDLVTKNGLVVLSTDSSFEGTDLSSDPIFKKAISSTDLWHEFDNKYKIPSTITVSPVLDKVTSQLTGAVITKRGAETAFEILRYGKGLGETGQSYIVNNERLMITPSRFIENAPYNVRVDTEPVRKCFEHNDNFRGYYQDYRGVTVFGISQCNIILGFVLIAEIDRSEILSPVTVLKDYSILLISALSGLIIAIGIVISHGITDPLTKLVQVIQRIAEGDLKARAEELGDQEIVKVSTALNQMTASLKSSREAVLQSKNIIEQQLEELKEADVNKDEFASMVTHELKTPLTPIKGRCEMLLEAGVLGQLTPAQEQSIHIIYNSATRLERLVSDILDAQKIDMNRMKFNKDKIEIKKFMEDISRDHLPLINEKEITFLNTTTSNSTIVSDEGRLTQVMTNLIRNAVDFVQPKTGLINIAATDKDSNVVFYVKDNGTGIPKEQQPNLFKKFFQIDTSARRKHGGTGLGLVICKGILEAQGGKIWFESEEGKGTTFYFSMPKDDDSKVI